jgi:predicted lactoylglutathione lyase
MSSARVGGHQPHGPHDLPGVVYEPSQREWGAFAAHVADPDGHLWMILVTPPDWSE